MVGEPAGHRRLIEAVAAVYEWIAAQQIREPHRAGQCNACGACCDFPAYGHRLYVTTPELIYLTAKLNVLSPAGGGWATNPEISLKNTGSICLFPSHRLLPMPTGRCPYQQDNRCAIHEHRFAGCRIFTCRGDPDFQSELSEAALKRFKTLCEESQIPYRYQDLPTALNDGTCRSAGVPCPGDCGG